MDWLKLDNTAKIYLALLKQDNQNMFRVNAELYEHAKRYSFTKLDKFNI